MRKEPPFNPHKYEIVEEKEKEPEPKVLKESEMALFYDGEYLGEIGNSNVVNKPGMFEYDPELGLLINGSARTIRIENNDLIKIPHDLGHLRVAEVLPAKYGKYSDRQFYTFLANKYREFDAVIKKINYLAQNLQLPHGWDSLRDLDYCQKTTATADKQFRPEDLFESMLKEIEQKIDWEEDENKKEQDLKYLESLKNSGLFESRKQTEGTATLNYFYLCCLVEKIDSTNSSQILEFLKLFPFTGEILTEYEKNPDGRFGDALLIACAEYQNHSEQETL